MNTKRSFTLIELLVVVAIIAVLVAILLPALSRARSQALTISCLSSLKQISLADFFYAEDFRGYPPEAWSGPDYFVYKGPNNKSWARVLLDGSYVKAPNLFRCPAHRSRFGAAGEHVKKFYFQSLDQSCARTPVLRSCHAVLSFNQAGEKAGGPDRMAFRMEDWARHHWESPYDIDNTIDGNLPGSNDKLLDLSVCFWPWDLILPDEQGTNGTSAIHRGNQNVLFIDGHVKTYRYAYGTQLSAIYPEWVYTWQWMPF